VLGEGVLDLAPLLVAHRLDVEAQHFRAPVVIPVLAIAVGATLVFTVAAGTRYRAPLEPMIAMMAVAAFVPPRPEPEEREQ